MTQLQQLRRHSMWLVLTGFWLWSACTFPSQKACTNENQCNLGGPGIDYCFKPRTTSPGVCKKYCKNDLDCPAKEGDDYCEAGKCIPKCQLASDCQLYEQCDTSTGKCTPKSCENDVDCRTKGYTCKEKLCSQETPPSCDPPCQANEICEAGMCKPKATGCKSDADCTGGQKCNEGTCLDCIKNDDCTADQECDTATGKCKPKATGCENDTDCTGGQICKDGKCQGCAKDSDCSNGQKCDIPNQKCIACQTDTDCEGKQICKAGICIFGACNDDGDCGNAKGITYGCRNKKCRKPCAINDDCEKDTCIENHCSDLHKGCGTDCQQDERCDGSDCTLLTCTIDSDCNIIASGMKCDKSLCRYTCTPCKGNELCIGGACYNKRNCITDKNCPTDQICENKKCTPPPCTKPSDCKTTLPFCLSGRCSKDKCNSSDTSNCLVSEICVNNECKKDPNPETCPSGLDVGCSKRTHYCEQGLCTRICLNDAECSQGQVCSAGRCQKPQVDCANANIKMPGGVCIESGTFLMGMSAQDNIAQPNEKPQHTVHITHRFVIGKYEVRYSEFNAVVGAIPAGAQNNCQSGNKALGCPLNHVTWHQAAIYANKLTLNHFSSADQCFTCTGSNLGDYRCELVQPYTTCLGYRLPTEAEWEYAARAGTKTNTYNGDISGNTGTKQLIRALDDIAWYDANSSNGSHSVGEKMPNAWGLYDMLGNLREWVADIGNTNSNTDNYPGRPRINPLQLKSDGGIIERALRGCHNDNPWNFCRSSHRQGPDQPQHNNAGTGFRIVRTLPYVQP